MSVTRLSINPAITKLCPSCSSNSVSALRVLKRGHGESGNGQGIREIQRADFGRNLQVDVAVGRDHRGELQPHAEFLERNRHRSEAVARLHDRERELAAGEETGFLAVHRNQIRLGENLQKILRLERLDHRAEVDVGTEQEQVQDVVDAFRRWWSFRLHRCSAPMSADRSRRTVR